MAQEYTHMEAPEDWARVTYFSLMVGFSYYNMPDAAFFTKCVASIGVAASMKIGDSIGANTGFVLSKIFGGHGFRENGTSVVFGSGNSYLNKTAIAFTAAAWLGGMYGGYQLSTNEIHPLLENAQGNTAKYSCTLDANQYAKHIPALKGMNYTC